MAAGRVQGRVPQIARLLTPTAMLTPHDVRMVKNRAGPTGTPSPHFAMEPKEKPWQPVGESNPSFQVENLTS